ncbi:Uso1_p115_C domain-containing protein, partial [Haematococcus lacustris]
GPGGLYREDEVEARVAAAVAALEGQVAEAEEQLTDLLVCLGQEEQKVALLSEALMARGIDVDAMLASIQPEQEA